MGKLIIDKAALQFFAERVKGQSFGGHPDGIESPGIVNVLDYELADQWQPANDETVLLVCCKEACHEITHQARGVEEAEARPRILKGITTPLVELMDHLIKLTALPGDFREQRKRWPDFDRNNYDEIRKRIANRHQKGPVRQVRHKLGSHIDPKVLRGGAPRVNAEDVLSALGDCAIVLGLIIKYETTYAWIRFVGASGEKRVVDTIQGQIYRVTERGRKLPSDVHLIFRWLTDEEGHVLDVKPLHLGKHPNADVRQVFHDLTRTYNEMVSYLPRGTGLREIVFYDTEDLLDAEALERQRPPAEALTAGVGLASLLGKDR